MVVYGSDFGYKIHAHYPMCPQARPLQLFLWLEHNHYLLVSQTSHCSLVALDLHPHKLQVQSPPEAEAVAVGGLKLAPQPVNPPVTAGLDTGACPGRGCSQISQAVLVPLDCRKHSVHVQVSLALTVEAPGLLPQPVNPVILAAGMASLRGIASIELDCTASDVDADDPSNLKDCSWVPATPLAFCWAAKEVPVAKLGTLARHLKTKTGRAPTSVPDAISFAVRLLVKLLKLAASFETLTGGGAS